MAALSPPPLVIHTRDWTGFPSPIPPDLSGAEEAVVHSDVSSFSTFIQNLHHLPKLKYLEIRDLNLPLDECTEDSFDIGSRPRHVKELVVELRVGLDGYLNQLKIFFSKSSQHFKARVIFPVKVNGLHTAVCRESFRI